MTQTAPSPCRITIFASGNGSNAQAIMDRFADSEVAEVVLVASDKAQANVLNRARRAGIETRVMEKALWSSGPALVKLLRQVRTDLLVLAGYLKLIPVEVVEEFRGCIMNVHPSLLPKYGGKGFYGMRVHEAVISAKEKESGVTVHLVNEEFDKGKILVRESVAIQPDWSAEDLAREIHKIEHRIFPEAVEHWCRERRSGSPN